MSVTDFCETLTALLNGQLTRLQLETLLHCAQFRHLKNEIKKQIKRTK